MIIELRVVPNAKKEQVKCDAEQIKVYLRAPAVDGKANQALIVFLADCWHLPKSALTIVSGQTSRTKRVEVSTALSLAELKEKLCVSMTKSGKKEGQTSL